MKPTEPLCRDCFHYKAERGEEPKCIRKVIGHSLVSGDKIYWDCQVERYAVNQDACGKAGQFFQAKSDKQPF